VSTPYFEDKLIVPIEELKTKNNSAVVDIHSFDLLVSIMRHHMSEVTCVIFPIWGSAPTAIDEM
jgi:hypothetical protein